MPPVHGVVVIAVARDVERQPCPFPRATDNPRYDRAMPHIRLIEPEDADGLLAEQYDAATERAGKIFNIIKAMSPNPAVMERSMEMYRAIMFGPSKLTRVERELLATVTSRTNECRY